MKKHMIWLAELLLWGFIIFSVLFVSFFVYNKKVSEKYTYYVFFKDIDGLIKGSPVKIQGYQVGYVSNISIVKNRKSLKKVNFYIIITVRKKKHVRKNKLY